MTTTANDMERLRARMIEAHERCGGMTHPSVVAVSRQLDEAIMDYYRSKRAAVGAPTHRLSWRS